MPAARHEEVAEFADDSPKDAQVDIESTWRSSQAHCSTAACMTAPLQQHEAQAQTVEKVGVGVQTEEKAQKPAKLSKKAEASLPGFIARACEAVEAEMVRVSEEQQALEPLIAAGEEQEQEPVQLLHCLNPFAHLGAAASSTTNADGSSGVDAVLMSVASADTAAAAASPYAKLVVTSVSWSCTGQSVAASYGRYDVAGWCTDKGALVCWNLGREGAASGGGQQKPDTMVEVDVCLMACAFHPEHPALIAGGTFNGDVYVWDLSQEGHPQRGKSDTLCDVRHQEPICSISWQYSQTEANKYGNKSHAYRLVTLGADGRVLVWTWHKLSTPIYAYQLLWPAPGSERKILWGGTCMSFTASLARTGPAGSGDASGAASGSSSHFMVGTEGGRVFKCAYDLNSVAVKEFQKALSAGEVVEPACPIKDASYQQHAGAVYALHCCPHQRDLFLTAGSDGSVRLYHSLRGSPLLALQPAAGQLLGVQWSPIRPLVFAVAAADGNAYVYDLMSRQHTQQLVRPALTLDASIGAAASAAAAAAKSGQAGVNCVAFNARRHELFAAGCGNAVMVWQLPSSLAKLRRGEGALLRKVAAADDAIGVLRGTAA